MSPKAIQSLIDMFGVEHGVQILNLFTASDNNEVASFQKPPVRQRPNELLRDAAQTPELPVK